MLFCDYNNLIVTELWNGTLYDLVTVNKDSSIKLSSHQLRDVVLCQIVDGVEYLHHYNIIHRDLKPHNILYRTEPTLMMKVADFGGSRFLPQDATHYTCSVTGSVYSPRFSCVRHQRMARTRSDQWCDTFDTTNRHLYLGSHFCVHVVRGASPAWR